MSDMKFSEFMKQVLPLFPCAEVDADLDGQLVIYTGLQVTADQTVVPHKVGE